MRYLLVGNGPSIDLNKLRHADAVIQFNSCMYADRVSIGKTLAVFVTNVGEENGSIISKLLERKHLFPGITVKLARNPLFYGLKARAAVRARSWIAPYCQLNDGWDALPWPVEVVSLATTIRLEFLLRRRKMHRSFMPSTGMVAYYAMQRRLLPGDSLDFTGFTFEGWGGHPWEIEKRLIIGVYPPGYRDDPSYEKRARLA